MSTGCDAKRLPPFWLEPPIGVLDYAVTIAGWVAPPHDVPDATLDAAIDPKCDLRRTAIIRIRWREQEHEHCHAEWHVYRAPSDRDSLAQQSPHGLRVEPLETEDVAPPEGVLELVAVASAIVVHGQVAMSLPAHVAESV